MDEERSNARQRDTTTPPATTSSSYESSTSEALEPALYEGSPPYALYLAMGAIFSVSIIFTLTMWIFVDLFRSAATVTSALGSLFTLIGTVSGAYFGIKVANDTAQRSVSAIEEANQRAERAYQLAYRSLAELEPQKARGMLTSGPE